MGANGLLGLIVGFWALARAMMKLYKRASSVTDLNKGGLDLPLLGLDVTADSDLVLRGRPQMFDGPVHEMLELGGCSVAL